ncbi:MAG TPA: TIGR02444 family protein [Ramlibacter sp.]|nr:TIGR02444 family protein [Ramlibacter sp.]
MNPEAAWAFIVERYAAPGRAEALLHEQERSGLDIVLHLFMEYLREREGRAVDDTLVAEAAAAVAAWRAQVITPLRSVRRLLKEAEAQLGAPAQPAEELRGIVKGAELRSERIELEMLCRWWGRRAAAA